MVALPPESVKLLMEVGVARLKMPDVLFPLMTSLFAELGAGPWILSVPLISFTLSTPWVSVMVVAFDV